MPLFKRKISASIEKDNLELITVRDFRMGFSIKKTSSSEPNTCSFKIYNLNSDTMNKMNEIEALLTINAGYQFGDGEEVIFIGNITHVFTSKDYPNSITTIEARDGEEPLLITRDSISFKEGVSVKQIIDTVAKKFRIGLKTNLNLLQFSNKNYSNGFAFVGQLRELLDKVTKDAGLEWSVQNNELKFYGKTQVDQSVSIVLNGQTGMIGSPERIKIKKGKKTDKVEIDGWKVFSFLQPKAEPGGEAVITSQEIGEDKSFKIETVEHNGDNWEGDFTTMLEVIEYGK